MLEDQNASARRSQDSAPPPQDNRASRDDSEIDILEIVFKIWKGKLYVMVAMATALVLTFVILLNTQPIYQADALLQLEENSNALALPSEMSDLLGANDPRSVTEIEIIRSRLVVGQAVASLNLDWRVEPSLAPGFGTMVARYNLPVIGAFLPVRFARPGDSLVLQQLTVPPSWLDMPLELTVGEAGTFTLATPDGESREGRVGEPLALPDIGFYLTMGRIEAPEGRVYTLKQVNESAAISSLRDRLSVSERGRSSGILDLRITGPDSAENVRALNAVLNAYRSQNVSRSAAQAEGSLDFIRQQIPQAEQTLRDAEDALNAFRQQQVSVDLTLETQTLLTSVTNIEGQIAELRQREDELSQRYTPSHPTYRLLIEERTRLEARLAELRSQVGELPETQRQIVNLTRDMELAQRLYTELLTRAQQVEVLRASTIGNVRIVDTAAATLSPISPRRVQILMIGLLLGMIAGVGFVILRDILHKGIQDASEIEQLGLPMFATINYSPQSDTRGKRKEHQPILALERPDDLAIEAFRSLRTSLHFGMLDARSPTLAVTSAHPSAGKSFVSTNLAVVAAQAGQRVCLIDADMRRGQLRRFFNLPRSQPGLAEILSGERAVEDVILLGPVPDFYVIPTGKYPPNPSELLLRKQMHDLLEWCSENFDLTILDCPPTLAVTDPVIVSREAGATLFIARHDLTHPKEIDASIKIYASAGLRFNGAVLNGFDPRKARSSSRYGYAYGYRYEYKQRTD